MSESSGTEKRMLNTLFRHKKIKINKLKQNFLQEIITNDKDINHN